MAIENKFAFSSPLGYLVFVLFYFNERQIWVCVWPIIPPRLNFGLDTTGNVIDIKTKTKQSFHLMTFSILNQNKPAHSISFWIEED